MLKTKIILCALLIVGLLSMAAILHAQDESRYDRDTLLSMIESSGNEGQVIQPGSESFNRDFERQMTIWERVFKWLSEVLERINSVMERLFPSGETEGASGGILGLNWLAAAIIAAVLIFFFLSIIPFLRGRSSEDHLKIDETTEGFISISMTNAMDKAENLAGNGDFYGALKELLRGFFMGLDEVNKIPYRKSRTNREYQRLIRRQASVYSGFAGDFLPYMESILYAGIEPDPQKYHSYRDSLKKSFSR